MTYSPKKPIKQEQEEIEIKVSKRIDELLSSIKQIGSMYVEPGDIVIVQVSNDASPEMISHLQKMLSAVFKHNRGIFVPESIQFKILKKQELYHYNDIESQIEKLQQEVQELKNKIKAIQGL